MLGNISKESAAAKPSPARARLSSGSNMIGLLGVRDISGLGLTVELEPE